MDFVAGSIGGAAGCVASHPLDTIKVRMQCCQATTGHSTWQCFRHIVKNESVSGLYKGLASPLCTVAAINSVCFGCYGAILRQTHYPNSLRSHFIAGAGAGLAICPLMCPMELAKCKLQMQNLQTQRNPQLPSLSRPITIHQRLLRRHHTFSGPMDCLRTVYKTEGYIGLNRGMLGLIIREVPAIATYFTCYAGFQQIYRQSMEVEHCPFSFLFLAGGVSGCLSWACSYPADVLKSRLQCDGKYDARRKRFRYQYTGYMDCLCKSVKADGYSVLYRGLLSSMLRAFPNNGVCLMVVSICHSLYSRERVVSESQTVYDAA